MSVVTSKVFRLPYGKHERIRQAVGSGERVLYTSRLSDDGELEIIPSGKEDLYASIQSHKDSCDIHVLLSRYRNGDVDALSRVQGAYGDFSNMPGTYAELLNSVIAGENYFNSLPVEIRAKFDHSLEKFLTSMDDMPSWMEKMGMKVEEAPAPTDSVKEVKEDEQE